MFAKFKGAIISAVGNLEGTATGLHGPDGQRQNPLHPADRGPPLKFRYTRPHFLQLNSDDEILVSADHGIRPIIVPRDISKLPWNSGYAECINAGKSIRNEDQAAMHKGLLRAVVSSDGVASKVADMMPTVPGYPRQVPINVSKSPATPSPFEVSRPSSLPVGPAVPGSSAAVVNGAHSKDDTTTEKSEEASGNGEVAAKVEENGCGDQSEASGPSDGVKQPETPLNANDLLSPSSPLPLSELNAIEVEVAEETKPSTPTPKKTSAIIEESLPWVYFGIFDGHAGSGVAVAAAATLQKIVQEKLQNIADLLIEFGLQKKRDQNGEESSEEDEPEGRETFDAIYINKKTTHKGSVIINHDKHIPDAHFTLLFQPATDKIITVDSLIIGALESAFWEMDKDIAQDKHHFKMSGGCTAVVSLFILGKLYVANAGDSRCIMYKNSEIIPMSFDHTPESERERVKYLGLLRPDFLGHDFTHLEFVRRPARRDLGKKLLYRDAFMTGWSYKTVTIDDLRFPLVYGEGKRSRVLATIGVTRGFGDHELKAQNSQVDIKPFLTPQPEVRVFDLEKEENLTDSDVIIMGTDGLWDVTTNEKAVDVVQKALDHFPANDQQRFKYRYISAAQDLVMTSRGKSKEKGKGWKTSDNKIATIDDISVFVIPLKPYQQEFKKWREARDLVRTISESESDLNGGEK